jgi:hypothetical protein
VEPQRYEATLNDGTYAELVLVPWTAGPLRRIDPHGPEREQRLGIPIDPSDPDVRALIASYEALLADCGLPPAACDVAVVVGAHAALLETASLLRCGPPAGPAEREYVRRRTGAIRDLADPWALDQLDYLRRAIGEPGS